ncbi:LapA family protein [Marinomonas agarivorans]|nr:LapA family protein [Marinomonas agarivorans]
MLNWFSRVIFIVVLVFFLVVGIFFAVRNPGLVTLDFIVWTSPEFSISLYLLLAFFLGVVIAFIASSVVLIRTETSLRVLRKRCTLLQKELDTLRKASLTQNLTRDGE